MKSRIFRHEFVSGVMKFKIRHETPFSPVMDFYSSVMNSNSRHEIILRHESLYDGMKAIIFRHEILYPPS